MSIDDFEAETLIGREVGTCTILREVARGGMGIVFVAYQRTLKRQIAIKILPKCFLKELAAQRFQQEAESAAILSHPNIVPIYEVGDTDEFYYFTMQLVQGSDLSDTMERVRKHPLPSKRSVPLRFIFKTVCQVLNALGYAHAQEIVHRDIKPENILVEKHTERPLISDFGVAKLLRGDTVDSGIRGTPIYMAPEQIQRAGIDGRTDIYSVGVLLLELLVLDLPLPNTDSPMEIIRRKLELKDRFFQQTPSNLNTSLAEEIDVIVNKATAYDPAHRYKDCREFACHLQAYEDKYIK